MGQFCIKNGEFKISEYHPMPSILYKITLLLINTTTDLTHQDTSTY